MYLINSLECLYKMDTCTPLSATTGMVEALPREASQTAHPRLALRVSPPHIIIIDLIYEKTLFMVSVSVSRRLNVLLAR